MWRFASPNQRKNLLFIAVTTDKILLLYLQILNGDNIIIQLNATADFHLPFVWLRILHNSAASTTKLNRCIKPECRWVAFYKALLLLLISRNAIFFENEQQRLAYWL